MQITEVKIRKKNADGSLRGIVSVTLENVFVVHDIKVIEGDKGLFIAMPSRKSADGIYRDIAHPINTEYRAYMQDIILDAYNKEVNKEVVE